ncbi:hypothetical protein UA32_12550 [Photobacterium angustum]|uniref:Uncharacterized protein n=1 Tax=Photobacterium angustum TaxID=661 RepID=A0ABX5H1Z4_PHOAN|nr:hypothetical protein [Photobacterium angustum]KJG37776.1 hypothetical protein UA32_12550 [Photobacterium angustum]PSX07045.1 hypothetical protein C0W27_15870 [Photobacterium angustum]
MLMFRDPVVLLLLVSVSGILYLAGSLKLLLVVVFASIFSVAVIVIFFTDVVSDAFLRLKSRHNKGDRVKSRK